MNIKNSRNCMYKLSLFDMVFHNTLRPRLFIIVILLFIILNSCEPLSEEITIYVMQEQSDYLEYVIDRYNRTQEDYYVKIKKITELQLRDVLENNISQQNLFLFLTRHNIIARAKDKYLIKLYPQYEEYIRPKKFNQLGRLVVNMTFGYGYPLYAYSFESPAGISVSMIGVPKLGYKTEHKEALLSIFSFLSTPEINALALLYNKVPVYGDAQYDLLSKNEKRRLGINLPRNKLDGDLQPKTNAFIIAP